MLFYNDKLCTSFLKESLNLILSRLRTLNISYTVIHKNNKEEYIGKDINYIKFYNKAYSLREREILIEKILYKLKLLDLSKLKEIENMIERK